jgi:CheY-like chemotaxis protein
VENRVLIVDDNGAFRAAARQLLERAGFAVVAEAESGAGGVEEAKAHNPDVAIVDVQLPDFDGFEVAARLSELGDAPRVILVSSLDGADLGALVAGSSARSGSFRKPSSRLRSSTRCSPGRADPRHCKASTASNQISIRANRRVSASPLPTTPSSCAKGSRSCSRTRGSRSSVRAAPQRICC